MQVQESAASSIGLTFALSTTPVASARAEEPHIQSWDIFDEIHLQDGSSQLYFRMDVDEVHSTRFFACILSHLFP